MEETNIDFLETDNEAINEYAIPVEWMVTSTLRVKARNLKEAIDWVEDNINLIKRPQKAFYVEESFRLEDRGSFTEHEYIDYIQSLYNSKSNVSDTDKEFKKYVKEWCNGRGYYDEFLDNDLLDYVNKALID